MKSKYLKRFQSIAEELQPKVTGNRMLVEVLPKEEMVSEGGIIFKTVETHKSDVEWLRPKIAVVLMKGAGSKNDNGTIDENPFNVGNVILVSEHSPKAFAEFPGLEGITSDEIAIVGRYDVHFCWENLEHFEQYCEASVAAK